MTCTTSSERCLAPRVVLTPSCSRICIQGKTQFKSVAAILLVHSSPPTVESTARTTCVITGNRQCLRSFSTVHIESDFVMRLWRFIWFRQASILILHQRYLLLLSQKTGDMMPCRLGTGRERTRASPHTYTQGRPEDIDVSRAIGSTPIYSNFQVSFTTASHTH
ncbi:hypothetical protein EDD15DRAFT_2319234 [Pisolithus albus]|nr:hypothetical protein EDD15DRAFT_2319234 [Pisolithus albus]